MAKSGPFHQDQLFCISLLKHIVAPFLVAYRGAFEMVQSDVFIRFMGVPSSRLLTSLPRRTISLNIVALSLQKVVTIHVLIIQICAGF